MTASDMIRLREQQFFAAQTASDLGALEAVFSEELRFVHSTGVVDSKSGYLDGVRTGRYAHGDIDVLHHRVLLAEDGTGAVSISVIDLASKPLGGPEVTLRLHHLLGWRQEAGEWRIAFRQGTKQPL